MSFLYSTFSQELCYNSFSVHRVENSSGQGFDLLWEGPNATNVPKEAAIVDSSSPDIILSNPSQWFNGTGVDRYRQNELFTNQTGASLNFTFDGVAIWYACGSYI